MSSSREFTIMSLEQAKKRHQKVVTQFLTYFTIIITNCPWKGVTEFSFGEQWPGRNMMIELVQSFTSEGKCKFKERERLM